VTIHSPPFYLAVRQNLRRICRGAPFTVDTRPRERDPNYNFITHERVVAIDVEVND
jgi:hypothetical protein